MSGIELSRVRTELRLILPETYQQSLMASREADIVMQSSKIRSRFGRNNKSEERFRNPYRNSARKVRILHGA
jgi:hypothetical protein